MNRYEQLITDWTEAMHAKLEIHKNQAENATRADYHKGLADGLVTGLSYAMATLAQMERRAIANAMNVTKITSSISNSTITQNAEGIKMSIIAPSGPQEETKAPVIKRVIAFKCEHCGDEGVVFADPTKPILCNKCQKVHRLKPLLRASYYCECGKICKFVMESTVERVKCHCCKKPHRMAFSKVNNEFYSLDNRDRDGYVAKSQAGATALEYKTKSPINKRMKETPRFHANTCLECNEEFMSEIENCVTCDKCAGDNK